MDELAGLRDSAPPTYNVDPTSNELAQKTGFITNFSGPNNKKGAAWADAGPELQRLVDFCIPFVASPTGR